LYRRGSAPERRRRFSSFSSFLPLTRRQLRAVIGMLWLLDAGLQLQPDFFSADWWRGDLAQSAMGQPAAVNHSIFWAVGLVASHHPAVWNAAAAMVQGAIGVCLLVGRLERTAIAASVSWAVVVWWVGEGFGNLLTGFGLFAAGSPGPVLYYALLALLAWPRGTADSSRNVVDGRLGALAWVALWVGGAALELTGRFPPGQVLQANLAESSSGQPSWLAFVGRQAYQLAGHHPVLLASVLGASEFVIGMGYRLVRTRKAALVGGAVASAIFWVVFQQLGGLAGGGATDPGAAPLLVVLALGLWPRPNPATAERRDPAAPSRPARAWRVPASGLPACRSCAQPPSRPLLPLSSARGVSSRPAASPLSQPVSRTS
jgi:hypothetical protein